MAQSFYSWLLKFKNDDTAIGDLARDARVDGEFPRHSVSYKNLEKYLESKHACEEAMDVFTEAFAQYKADRDLRLSNS
jgi:uncharacterized protein YozE (UPF0346 family)